MIMRPPIWIALVAGVSASTPPSYKPSNSDSLTATFGSGSTLKDATNGINVPRSATANPPAVYAPFHAAGNYDLLLVDPDASPASYLHWLQPVSISSTATNISSSQVYAVTFNSSGPAAIATYAQPSPPNSKPYTHRYVLLLLNTTSIAGVDDEGLSAAAQTRRGFDTATVVKNIPIVGSTWFNVTNEAALAAGNATASGTGSNSSSSSSSATGATSSATGGSATTSSAAATSSSAKANAATYLRSDAVIGGALGVALALRLL